MAALSKNEVPPWGLAIAGSTGAIIANALVYPLDIVKTRLQVQVKPKPGDSLRDPREDPHYTGTLHAISSIMEHEGIGGLYSGMAGALLGVASTNFAYFYWYSTVRTLYLSKLKSGGGAPGTAVELSLGAVAGALAQMFTIPIAVVTTRQQTQPKGQKKGMFATAKEVIDSEDGYSGLWRGFKASLVLVVNPAITYGAYQRLRDVLYPGKVNLRAHEAFRMFSRASLLPLPQTNQKNYNLTNKTPKNSPRRPLQIPRDNRHPAPHRRQSRPAVSPAPLAQWQALQILRRSHELHHHPRGADWPLQRNRPPDPQGSVGARVPDDDQGADGAGVCAVV
jgi:hypothetical protein